jgi:hypothetical protein
MDAIASLELIDLASDGQRKSIRVEIGRSPLDERGSRVCPVLLTTIDQTTRDIYGEDSMQALSLGVRFVHSMLQSVIDRGHRLLDTHDDTEFPLDAYFGKYQPSAGGNAVARRASD